MSPGRGPLPPGSQSGSSLAVVVPTVGRPSLANLLTALAEQTAPTDRILVISDRPRRYDWCSAVVEGLRKQGAQGRWTVWDRDNLGLYGHAARNEALDHLATLEHGPDWCWSIDDDDAPAPDALARIRFATESDEAAWYLFTIRGGAGSHYEGVTVPKPDLGVRIGNIPTPSVVAPVSAKARWGLSNLDTFGGPRGEGYFGDGEYGVALEEELGAPGWRSAVVAEIRPIPAWQVTA